MSTDNRGKAIRAMPSQQVTTWQNQPVHYTSYQPFPYKLISYLQPNDWQTKLLTILSRLKPQSHGARTATESRQSATNVNCVTNHNSSPQTATKQFLAVVLVHCASFHIRGGLAGNEIILYRIATTSNELPRVATDMESCWNVSPIRPAKVRFVCKLCNCSYSIQLLLRKLSNIFHLLGVRENAFPFPVGNKESNMFPSRLAPFQIVWSTDNWWVPEVYPFQICGRMFVRESPGSHCFFTHSDPLSLFKTKSCRITARWPRETVFNKTHLKPPIGVVC